MQPPPKQRKISDLEFVCIQKGYKYSFKNKIKAAFSPSFICTSIYRLSNILHKKMVPIAPRALWWVNFLLFKVDIDQRACISGSIYFPHPMMITIGRDVKICGYCKIMQGVTIGGNLGKLLPDGQTQPLISGKCFFGINAIIIGPVTLKGPLFVSALTTVSKDFSGVLVTDKNRSAPLLPHHLNELKPL